MSFERFCKFTNSKLLFLCQGSFYIRIVICLSTVLHCKGTLIEISCLFVLIGILTFL